MTARQLRRVTQLPSKALFFFPEENTTGIAPTRLIQEKEGVAVGATVTVNWQQELVRAEIIAISGKYELILHVLYTRYESFKKLALTHFN